MYQYALPHPVAGHRADQNSSTGNSRAFAAPLSLGIPGLRQTHIRMRAVRRAEGAAHPERVRFLPTTIVAGYSKRGAEWRTCL